MPRTGRFLTRLWFYFRIGYATYLTFALGVVNTLVVVWYLAIRDIPIVESLFGHFLPFAITVSLVGTPLSIVIGWLHYKRSPAYTSELDIQVEANPYNYKIQPGYWKELFAPLYLELIVQMRRLLETQGLMDPETKQRISKLEQGLQTLIDGGYIGTPRRKM